MLAEVGSNPQCQQRIVDLKAIKQVALMLRIQFQTLEKGGLNRQEYDQAEDFLQSTMTLLYKLCDDPEGKAQIADEAIVPELVTIMQQNQLSAKSCIAAKEVLINLMGDKVVENENWLLRQTPQKRSLVAVPEGSPGSDGSPRSPLAEIYQDLLPGDTLEVLDHTQFSTETSALALQMSRRSVLGDILTQEPVMELSDRPASETIVTFADAVEKDVRKAKSETFMEKIKRTRDERALPSDPYDIGKPVTVLHKGESYLVSTTILPERVWDVGFAVCFWLAVFATAACAWVLHQEYSIKDYKGTKNSAGQPIENTEVTSDYLDVLTTHDTTGAWIWTADADQSQGVPVFVCIRSCVVGGIAAVVWGNLVCRTWALHAVEVVPVGLVVACWYWNTRLNEAMFSTDPGQEYAHRLQEANFTGNFTGNLTPPSAADETAEVPGSNTTANAAAAARDMVWVACGVRKYIWWFLILMAGFFFRAWYHGRKGRLLAMAFFNVGRLIYLEGDPWLPVVLLLMVVAQVVWTICWVIALCSVLSLDGEKEASLRTMLSWLMAISFFWSCQVFQYVMHVVGAACAASWYRTPPASIGTPNTCCPWTARRAAWRGWRKACTVSFGSICVASILANPVQFLRVALPQPPQLKYEGAPPAASSIPLVGKHIPPGVAAIMDKCWEFLTVVYVATIMLLWHVLDGVSTIANAAVFVQFPAANLSPKGPKMSGKYSSLASDAWRATNRAGLQPLRQEPLYYCLTFTCCFIGGAISAGWACTQIKGDYPCGTAELAIFLAFVCGFAPMATMFATGEGMVNALLTLFVEEQATLLQKDSRFYAAVLIAMEAAQAGGHLNAVGTTEPDPEPIEKKPKVPKEQKTAKVAPVNSDEDTDEDEAEAGGDAPAIVDAAATVSIEDAPERGGKKIEP